MLRVFLRRLGFALLVLLGAAVLVALALSVVPQSGESASILSRWGQYLHTVFAFDYGDFGNDEISKVLVDRGWTTLRLIGGGLFLMLLVGIPLGIARAFRPDSRTLHVAERCTRALSSVPVLVWAMVLLVLSTALFGVAPTYNYLGDASGGEAFLIYASPVVALALGDGMLSDLIRHVRSEAEQEIEKTYVRSLRARSVPVIPHVWRGIVGPLSSVISNKIAYLISGTIVIEYIFNWPGLARGIFRSIENVMMNRPDPNWSSFVLAATLVFVGLVLLLNLLGDFLESAVHPRL